SPHVPPFPTRRSSDLTGGPSGRRFLELDLAKLHGRVYQRRGINLERQVSLFGLGKAQLGPGLAVDPGADQVAGGDEFHGEPLIRDRKSTRLNSSHVSI